MEILEKLAEDISEPAKEMKNLGKLYSSQLEELDPAIRPRLELFENDVYELEEDDEEFLEALLNLWNNFTGAIDSLNQFVDAMDSVAKLSEVVREPLRDMEKGTRELRQSKDTLRNWYERAQNILL